MPISKDPVDLFNHGCQPQRIWWICSTLDVSLKGSHGSVQPWMSVSKDPMDLSNHGCLSQRILWICPTMDVCLKGSCGSVQPWMSASKDPVSWLLLFISCSSFWRVCNYLSVHVFQSGTRWMLHIPWSVFPFDLTDNLLGWTECLRAAVILTCWFAPSTLNLYRLVGFVVKTSASRVAGPGFDSCLCRDFSWWSHASDLKICTPVATWW